VELPECRSQGDLSQEAQRVVSLRCCLQGFSERFNVRFLRCVGLTAGILLLGTFSSSAVTLEQLRQDANLTPDRLIGYFRDFKFKLGEKIQSPEIFLAAQSGDCDDFASLAAEVLRERKYTTRLIAVFMDGQTHVICYVEEVKGFLDYNRRQDRMGIQSTNGDLEDMADKVAAFFRLPWRCVGEFTYQAGDRRIGRIVFR